MQEVLGCEALNELELLHWMSEQNIQLPVTDAPFLLDVAEHDSMCSAMADFDYLYESS